MEIAIYFEGGGNSAETKAILRQGMSAFLKPLVDMARQKRCRWSVTSCGGRDQALDAFVDALEKEPDAFNVLLVELVECGDGLTTRASQATRRVESRHGGGKEGASHGTVHGGLAGG
jgi:hypothetical protein